MTATAHIHWCSGTTICAKGSDSFIDLRWSLRPGCLTHAKMRASTSLRQFWLTHADTLHFQIVFAMIWLHVSKCLFHRCQVTGKVYKAPRQDGPTNLQLAHSSVPSRTLVSRLISNHGVDDLIKQSSLLITFFWSKKSIPTKLTRSNLLQYICFHLSKVTQSSNFDLEEAVVEIVVSVTPLSICGTPKRRMCRTQIYPGGIDVWLDSMMRPQFLHLWWSESYPQTNAILHWVQTEITPQTRQRKWLRDIDANMQLNCLSMWIDTHCKSRSMLISWLWTLPLTVLPNQRPTNLQSPSSSTWQLHTSKLTVSLQQIKQKQTVHPSHEQRRPTCCWRYSFFFLFCISNWSHQRNWQLYWFSIECQTDLLDSPRCTTVKLNVQQRCAHQQVSDSSGWLMLMHFIFKFNCPPWLPRSILIWAPPWRWPYLQHLCECSKIC